MTGCAKDALDGITHYDGPLRYEKDSYTIIELHFYGDNYSNSSYNNCCRVVTRYYRSDPTSPTGKTFDSFDESIIPCSITDNTVTLNGNDVYTYHLEERGKYEYIVFSKPFLDNTAWYIDKEY